MGGLTRPVLSTERLRLEPLTLDHTELLVELDSDRAGEAGLQLVRTYAGTWPYPIEGVERGGVVYEIGNPGG